MQKNNIDNLADLFLEATVKLAFIRKLPNGKWRVFSEKGKNLGTYPSEVQAKKRLRQIEFFKHKKASENIEIESLSYSAIMRDLNKNCDLETVISFMKLYKSCFDCLVLNNVEDIADKTLAVTIPLFNSFHKIKIVKQAGPAELGQAALVGKYLADIVRFTLNRIKPESRPKSINSLKRKIYLLNENELAGKKMPASSSMGQAITFIKHVLFAHEPSYIRQVLNSTVAHL